MMYYGVLSYCSYMFCIKLWFRGYHGYMVASDNGNFLERFISFTAVLTRLSDFNKQITETAAQAMLLGDKVKRQYLFTCEVSNTRKLEKRGHFWYTGILYFIKN